MRMKRILTPREARVFGLIQHTIYSTRFFTLDSEYGMVGWCDYLFHERDRIAGNGNKRVAAVVRNGDKYCLYVDPTSGPAPNDRRN